MYYHYVGGLQLLVLESRDCTSSVTADPRDCSGAYMIAGVTCLHRCGAGLERGS